MRPPRRRLRRLALLVSATALVGLDLALLLVCTRGLWLAPAARAAAHWLTPPGVDIQLGALETDLHTGLRLTDVRVGVRGADGLRVDVDVRTAVVHLDATALLGGELRGLRRARIDARHVEVTLPGSESGAARDDAPFELATVLPWLAALPAGGSCDVAALRIGHAGAAPFVDGPASAHLGAAPQRRLQAVLDDAVVEATLRRRAPGGAATLRLVAESTAPDPWVRRFAPELPLRGGSLRARLRLTDDLLAAEFDWRDAHLDGRPTTEAQGAELSGAIELLPGSADRRVAHARGALDVPGLRIVAHDLRIPLGTPALQLADLRGHLALTVFDLRPWRDVLPAPAQDWLPLAGSLSGHLDDAGLALDGGFLATRDARLRVLGGRLPAVLDTTARGGHLEAVLELDRPRHVRLPGVGDATLQGSIAAVVRGTLAAPEVELDLALGAGDAAGVAWREASAALGVGRHALELASVDVRGLRPQRVAAATGAAAASGADLSGAGRITLPATADDALVVDGGGALRGALDGWLDAWPAAPPALRNAALDAVHWRATALTLPGSSDELPRGSLRANLRGLRAAPDRTAPGGLELHLARGTGGADDDRFAIGAAGAIDPLLLAAAGLDPDALRGAGPVPLRADLRGSWAGEGRPRATLELELDRLTSGELPPGNATLVARLSPQRLDLELLALRGPLDADARGSIALDAGAVAELDLTARARLADSAALAPLWPNLPPGAHGALELRVHGPPAALQARGEAELTVPPSDRRRDLLAWPQVLDAPAPTGPLHATLQVAARPGAPPQLTAGVTLDDAFGERAAAWTASGSLPLVFAPDRGRLVPAPSGGLRGDFELRATATAGPLRVAGTWAWHDHRTALDGVVLHSPFGAARGHAELRLGMVDLLTASDRALALRHAPVAAELHLDAIALDELPLEATGIIGTAGTLTGRAAVSGTLAAPVPRAELRLADGRGRLPGAVASFDRASAELIVSPERIRLRDARAQLGVGSVAVNGVLRSADGSFAGLERGALDLQLTARDALLLRSTGVKLRADADLTARGALDTRIDVHGALTATSGKLVRRTSLVPELGERGGMSASTGLPLFRLPPPLGDRVHFDVTLRTAAPLELITHVCDAQLDAALRLRGTGAAPFLEGAVSTRSGTLRLPAISLDIDQGVVSFDAADPTHPLVAVRASTRRRGIDLRATASGRLDQVELVLSSMPPLTQEELYTLVSTGVLPETLRREGLSSRASMVGGYVAGEIFDFYFGSDSTEQDESFVDRFDFDVGREVSRNGVESVLVDFDIGGNFALRGERDIYEHFNMGLVYRFRF